MFGFGKPKDLCFRIMIIPRYFGCIKAVRKTVLGALKLSKIEKNYLSYAIEHERVSIYVNRSELKKLQKVETKYGMIAIHALDHRDRAEGGSDRKMK